MTQNPVTIADPKVASGNGIIDDLATPQPQPNQSAPGSDGSPIRRRLRYGAPSRILGRDGVSDEALAKSGPQEPYSDITEYLRAQDRVILDTVRLTQFT